MSLRYRPAGFLRMSWAAVALGVHAETQTWTGEGVPEPEPVAATITLGTYIFPGWYRAAGRGDYPYRTHTDLVPSAAKIVSFSMLTPEERAAAKALESQPHPVPPLAVRTTRVVADAPLPVRPPLKAWEFDTGVEGWACYQTEPLRVENGVLVARAAGDDPQILATGLNIDIGEIGVIILRLKAPEGMRFGQGFWATDKEPALSASKSFGIGLKPDGEWHTYRITKKPDAAWCGMLRTLRFDFGTAGDTVELDWIRIQSK